MHDTLLQYLEDYQVLMRMTIAGAVKVCEAERRS